MDSEIKLERKLSPVNIWALALGCIIGWGAFVMPGNTFLVKAGPLGTLIALGLAAVIMCIIAFNYNYMINKYPMAGGEFTFTNMEFGQRHAFICAWFLGLSYLSIVPLNATALALIGRNLMGNLFQVGFHYCVAGYDVYFGEILLAAGALILFAVFSIRGVKFTGFFQTALVFSLVLGVAVISIAALFSPMASFNNLRPAFAPKENQLGGVLTVLAVAPWAFVGFDTIPQAAEEFNFPSRKTKAIMIFSILFGALVYILLNTITAMTVPDGYTNWPEYINAASDLTGLESLPTFYAAYLLLGKWGLLFIGISVLAAILSGIVGFYMAASRMLYAMSNEGVLPKWFGKLHSKYKTPKNAILFVMCLSLMAPFLGRTALGWIADMSSAGAAIGYAYTSAAAYQIAKKEGEKEIVLTGTLGVIFGIIFLILLLIPIPALNNFLGKEVYICLAFWTLTGLAFYCYTLTHGSRKK